MKQFRMTTLALVLAVLAVAGYFTYQIAVNLTQKVQTVDAIEVTVEEKISKRGTFIREQQLIGGADGASEYLVQDGDKVAKGQRLAVVFSDASQKQVYDEADALQHRLDALQYAYSMVTSGVDSHKMDELITDDIMQIADCLSEGDAAHAAETYSAVQQLVISRGATEKDKQAFEAQMEELEKQIGGLRRKLPGSSSLRAPESGYFTGNPDGYETVLTPKMIRTLTPDSLEAIEPLPVGDEAALTTGFRWYCAVSMTEAEAAPLQQRDTVEVRFPELSTERLTMRVDRLETGADGKTILVLSSSHMEKEFLAARKQDVSILTGSYTGLKVPARALRQQEGEWGVYTLESGVVRFKPVSWIYSTDSYYLVPAAPSPREGLYRGDRIIVRGSGLADDMSIS